MLFSESKEIHQTIFKAIASARENADPLYNITDSKTFKQILINDGRLTEYTCGNDVALKFVLKAVNDYCTYASSPEYSYDYEVRLVQNIFNACDEYQNRWQKEVADIDKAAEIQFSKNQTINENLNSDQAGMKLIATQDLAQNSNGYVLKLNYCFDNFLTGTGANPTEEDLSNAVYGSCSKTKALSGRVLSMPCFTHLPTNGDITDQILESYPCFETIKASCNSDFRKILSMFTDNDDGTIWVKIYKDANGLLTPVFVKLHKVLTYLTWVLNDRHESLWTGLIIKAFEAAGIDCKNMSGMEFAKHCFGPDYNPASMPNKDGAYYLTHFSENASIEYTRYSYEQYLKLASTASYHIQVQEGIGEVTIAIKRLLVIGPTIIDADKSLIKEIIDLLQSGCEKYVSTYQGQQEKRSIVRCNICKDILSFCNLYNTDNADSMRPYTIFVANKKKS